MADAPLSALLTSILGNLNSHALEDFGIAWGLKSKLENLKSTFTTIQAVIHDAEKKQWKSEAVKNWLRKLKDAAYDVDDVLDEFATEALRQREGKNVRNQVSNFFSHRNSLVFRLKMGLKLKNVRDKLDAIAGERSNFHLTEGVRDIEVVDIDWRQTSSLVNESEIYGRDEEKEKIINMLLTNSGDHADVSVHAIWGMGGLGKTTLAQLVYNEKRVESVFDLRIWVCVSDDFEIRRLTKAILESVESCPCNIQELDPLQRSLQQKLRGRRFLLVLDDVRNEYSEKWGALKEVLRCGANGSATIVTTCIEKVAFTMATLPVHRLGRVHGLACMSNSMANTWPMVMISSSSEQKDVGRGDFQELDQIEAVKPFSKFSVKAKDIREIRNCVFQVLDWVISDRPGGCFLDLPSDVLHQTVSESEVKDLLVAAENCRKREEIASVVNSEIENVVSLLREAERPLIVCGKGTAYARVEGALKKMVEYTGIPFLPTPMRKGLIFDTHELVACAASSLANGKCDVALVVGARLNG